MEIYMITVEYEIKRCAFYYGGEGMIKRIVRYFKVRRSRKVLKKAVRVKNLIHEVKLRHGLR